MTNRSSELIESWADSLLRGKRAPTVVVLGIALFLGAVLTVLLQYPIVAGKIHDELSESALETTALIYPLPSSTNTNPRQKQEDAHLDDGKNEVEASQLRISQLESELRQARGRDDITVGQKQVDRPASQPDDRTVEQIRASQIRISELEAELSQRPTHDHLSSAQRLADELRSQLDQVTEQLRASQVRISQQEKELQAHSRTAHLTFIGRGDALLSSGDITSARLFYERAAEAGNAEAALRLGEIYDPAFLRRSRFQAQADSSRASFWYGRARELGSTEAEILLNGLQPR